MAISWARAHLIAEHATRQPRAVSLPARLEERQVRRAREQNDPRVPQAPALGLALAWAAHVVELTRRTPVHRVPCRRFVLLDGGADATAGHRIKEVGRGRADNGVVVEVQHASVPAQIVREQRELHEPSRRRGLCRWAGAAHAATNAAAAAANPGTWRQPKCLVVPAVHKVEGRTDSRGVGAHERARDLRKRAVAQRERHHGGRTRVAGCRRSRRHRSRP
jgi:hypothetical protein